VLPALRGRLDDLDYLAGRFVEEAGIELRKPVRELDSEALDLLRQHTWPGNVRELRDVVRHAIAECDALVAGPAHVRRALERIARTSGSAPSTQLESAPALTTRSLRDVASEAVQLAERNAIIAALRAANGNKSEAARRLKTNYKTLHVKIRQYGLREVAQSES
jgi:DNA-binding NtrC family response regulator